MVVRVALLVLLCLSGTASADILAWRDTDGVMHYTNLANEVPDEQRAVARVFVAERQPSGATDPERNPPVQEAPRQAQVICDRGAVERGYLDGLQRGLAASGGGDGGGSVQINGPLAIVNASPPPAYAPFGGYVGGYYTPLITTGFDRGRSRHLTLRLLLQDQFAIDREGPYAYVERLDGQGDLNPFLQRGLPARWPRGVRVITR